MWLLFFVDLSGIILYECKLKCIWKSLIQREGRGAKWESSGSYISLVSQLFCHFIYLKINFNRENWKKQVASWDFMDLILKHFAEILVYLFSAEKAFSTFNIFQADNIIVCRLSWISEAAKKVAWTLKIKIKIFKFWKKRRISIIRSNNNIFSPFCMLLLCFVNLSGIILYECKLKRTVYGRA
jgi:hypothetical protein